MITLNAFICPEMKNSANKQEAVLLDAINCITATPPCFHIQTCPFGTIV